MTEPTGSQPPLAPVVATAIVAGLGWVLLRRWLYDNSWTMDLLLGAVLAVVVAFVSYGVEKRRGR